jgi:hypothetical protein
MFWRVLLCGSSWTASSQSRRGNATSFGGSTTPQPWLMSKKKGGPAVRKSWRSRRRFWSSSPDVCPHTSGLHSHRGKHPGRCSVSLPRDSRLQLYPSVFRAISARWGSPSIDLSASRASKQTQRFFSWDASDNPEAVDALSQKWDFTLVYAFPPIPLFKRVVKKLETSKVTFVLVSPLWEAQT